MYPRLNADLRQRARSALCSRITWSSAILDAVARGKDEVVVPRFPYGLGSVAQALFPSLTGRVLALDSYR